jgi:hypothetical protein
MGRSRHVLWIYGLSAAIIGFDVFCWHRIAEQIASKKYLMVTGRVLHWQTAALSGSISGSVAEFSYGYRVNGKGYAGNTYRYVEMVPPPTTAAQMTSGRDITVFYNPQNPADAILARDLTDDDFGKMLQLVLLNLMLFSLLGLWTRWRVRTVFPGHQLWQA